jgi:hypothetical protein
MRILVDCDDWSIHEGLGDDGITRFHRLLRTYHLLDNETPGIGFVIRLLCTIESAIDLETKDHLHVFIKPMPLDEERTILLGLYAGQLGSTVPATAVPNIENDPLFLDAGLFMESSPTVTCIKALLAGTALTFSVSVPDSVEPWDVAHEPATPLFKVILPNGPEFKQRYDEVRRQIARRQWITKYRNSLKARASGVR